MNKSRKYLWLLLFFCGIGTINSFAKTNSTNIYGNPINLVKTQKQKDCLKTLTDISEDGSLYELNYTSDYQLDKFVKSNISSHEKLAIKVGFHLMKPLKTLSAFKQIKPACSAFTCKNEKGETLYCRNFDFPFKTGANLILHTLPKDGYQSISMVSMSFLGYNQNELSNGKKDISFAIASPYMIMDGMNEKGLAISVLYLDGENAQQNDKRKSKIMTTIAMRLILDKAATIDEAIQLLNQYNFYADGKQNKNKEKCNYHFLLADSTGKTICIEYIKNNQYKWQMNLLEENCLTNFYRSENWQNIGHGFERYNMITQQLNIKNNILTEEEAVKILKDVSQEDSGDKHSYTQWSIIYNLNRKTTTLFINRDYDKVYNF